MTTSGDDRHYRKHKRPTDDDIERLWYSHETGMQIAKRLGVTNKAVSMWFSRLKLIGRLPTGDRSVKQIVKEHNHECRRRLIAAAAVSGAPPSAPPAPTDHDAYVPRGPLLRDDPLLDALRREHGDRGRADIPMELVTCRA